MYIYICMFIYMIIIIFKEIQIAIYLTIYSDNCQKIFVYTVSRF